MRELPPLRHSVEVETPLGRFYRWADDEPSPINVPSGLRHSSTMPGGYESADLTLPRKPGIDYSDLERLSTLRVRDASGSIVSETRLERTPRTSGDQMAISPSAVGWQSHLEDDKSASVVILDRDLSRWRGPSATRQVDIITAGRSDVGMNVAPDTTGLPALTQELTDTWDGPDDPASEAWYDAGEGNLLSEVRATWNRGSKIDGSDTLWNWQAFLADADSGSIDFSDATANLRSIAASGSASVAASVDNRRFAMLRLLYAAAPAATYGVAGTQYQLQWQNVLAIGNHGLTIAGGPGEEGFLASDAIRYAVGRWAPALTVTDESVQASDFLIPQGAFYDPTTVGEIVRQLTRFGLQDWAVWEGLTFWWHPRGARGRSWRARIAPAQLEETGPQVDRLWTSVIVQYQDVDGSTRTVGPPGSGAGFADASLEDLDPDSPAIRRGITRRDLLTMGIGTAASATEVGRRFLEEQKLLDTSGRAQFVGHVEDDRGVLHPYSHVRAGDNVTFVDAADSSARRIVRAEHDHGSRTCSVDLDAPPEGLAALLERLGVVLTPLGV